MFSRLLLPVALCAVLCHAAVPEAVISARLGPAIVHPPVVEADWNTALPLGAFQRANWAPTPATATKGWIAWDEKNLYVRIWSADPNPVSRGGKRLVRTDIAELYLRMPGAAVNDVWKFSLSEAGEKASEFATKAPVDGRATTPQLAPIAFEAQATVEGAAWTARFAIPWASVGGRPTQPFGLQLARERSISDEVMSPSAIDYHEGPSLSDEFIETTLGGRAGIRTAAAGLIAVPSGIRRWQLPATLEILTVAERKAVWMRQQQLSQPTTAENFAERIQLAGELYHSLIAEGMAFNGQSGEFVVEPAKHQLSPWAARMAINEALRAGAAEAAYPILDNLLQHLDQASRAWYADQSPGNVRDDQWTSLNALTKATVTARQIDLEGMAGKQRVTLSVSWPAVGGVRVSGADRGFFNSEALAFQVSKQTANGLTASNGKFQVEIELKPHWRIAVKERSGNSAAWKLQQGDVAFRFSPEGKILATDLTAKLAPQEDIWGFGERFDTVGHRGAILNLWQQDAWDGNVLGAPRNESYKTIPLWHSTSGYSIFWNSSYRLRADIGCLNPAAYRVTVNGPVFDLYVWPEAPKAALESYAALTGKPRVPPRWTFETWAGGGGGRWGGRGGAATEGQPSAAETQIDVMTKFHALDIPESGIYAEGAGATDPRTLSFMEPRGIHVFAWRRSQSQTPERSLPSVAAEKLPVLRWEDGTPVGYPQPGHPLRGHFPYVDFTNPLALDLERADWKPYLDLGDSGSMLDFGDLVPPGAKFFNGSRGDAMHNLYAYFYHKTIAQVFRERRGEDYVLFARGGAPGDPANVECFVGDLPSNFGGLTAAIKGGLNVATAGFSNWGSDMGGYTSKGDEEVYIRWVEFAAFSPIMRAHGQRPREPWFYGDHEGAAAVSVFKRLAWVRENLLDYMDAAALSAHESGIPMMQPLALAFPDERALAANSDEYLFGPDLLAAPVHTEGETRELALPRGRWTNLWDGSILQGGSTQQIHAALDEIPVYLRSGALVPLTLATSLRPGESMTPGKIDALLVTPPETAGKSRQLRRDAEASDYASEPTANGFRVTLARAPRIRFAIAIGMPQAPVKVTLDGIEIPRLTEAQIAAPPVGWHITDDKRLVVRLPQNRSQSIEIFTR